MKQSATCYILVSIIISCGILAARSQEIPSNQPSSDDDCFNYDDSCRSCIGQPGCQWCSQPKAEVSGHYCFSIDKENLQNSCQSTVENPTNSEAKNLLNKDLTTVDKNSKIDYNNIVQLKPQKIKLELRKGVPKNITLTYRQVKDYPLDLYYMMDLSKSMAPDKKTLAVLGRELARTMRTLTSQFRIGFGSFVDKVMAPFVNVHPNSLRVPCTDMDCATPFSFINNLELVEDAELFTKKVEEAKISSNLDSPEGGLDALMQAMVCEKEIGWRKNVRKIIVLSTDNQFHYAGDGKLAGVIAPNDKKCHLNGKKVYEQFDLYDYPSISQIDEVAQEKGINIIFAVKGYTSLYKELSERIKDSAYGELTAKSSNVIDLVTKVYKSITGKVEIGEKSRLPDSPIALRFFSSCDLGGEKKQTNVCNDVTEGTTFDFDVEITVTDCPKDGSRKKKVEIGTLQDSVTLEIDLQCDCGCEAEGHPDVEKDSKDCSYYGTKKCGVCECNLGYYGKSCQCSRKEGGNVDPKIKSDPNKCRPEGSNTSVPVCGGRGRCECEECNCWDANFYGKFCECNKKMCRQQVDSTWDCSGHGKCECNECRCTPGWEGKHCECQDKVHCVNPAGGGLCSGKNNGECKCGRCECKVPFTGRFCEECPTCGDGKCREFRPCVQCKAWKSGEYDTTSCEKNCSSITMLDELSGPLSQFARLCTFTDESTGCDFNFTYQYRDPVQGYTFYAQNRQICPEDVDILAVAIGVVVGVVAIGVLTLVICKLAITIHDRREYAKFENESQKAKWNTDDNPLYKNPTTTVSNPGFAFAS